MAIWKFKGQQKITPNAMFFSQEIAGFTEGFLISTW